VPRAQTCSPIALAPAMSNYGFCQPL
jgi:hypothetical protein